MKEPKIVKDFNIFIEKWTDKYSAHLLDSDENEGEYFRIKLRRLANKRRK